MEYVGIKTIDARPMNLGEYNEYRSWRIPENEDPMRDGYLVVYPDGYVSWSPKEVFEGAYRKNGELSYAMASHRAIAEHKRIARSGWNGKDMWVEAHGGVDHKWAIIEPFLIIKNVRNSFNPWVPSSGDLFANDWVVLDDDDE